jgi:alpha-methylacyl-CoA racemase
MMLADMGAEVVRILRGAAPDVLAIEHDIFLRGRHNAILDLKSEAGRNDALAIVDRADAVIEGFRPGVMERLGLGPEVCLARNPRLVYGRMTGWGREGPLASAAGHDINFTALSGALHAIGTAERPVIPLNLVADLGGGGMLLAFGIVCGLLEARRSGKGQTVDAAMIDGASLLMAMTYSFFNSGQWEDRRGVNLTDGGHPYYNVYRCSDGKWISIGPIEPQFFRILLDKCGIEEPFRQPVPVEQYPALRAAFERTFATKTRDEWCAILEGSDACFAPVLSLAETPLHPQNVARNTFVTLDGQVQPAPAPRFERTPPQLRASADDGLDFARSWGAELGPVPAR